LSGNTITRRSSISFEEEYNNAKKFYKLLADIDVISGAKLLSDRAKEFSGNENRRIPACCSRVPSVFLFMF